MEGIARVKKLRYSGRTLRVHSETAEMVRSIPTKQLELSRAGATGAFGVVRCLRGE